MIKKISRTAMAAVITAAAVAFPGMASAQGRIDKMVDYLEKRPDATVTYTEKRSEKKKKLYKISRVITFSNEDYVPRIRAAFEAERDRAVSAVKNGNSMVFKFADKNGNSNYVFTAGDGAYTLVQSWESKTVKPTSAIEIDRSCDDAGVRTYAIIVNDASVEIRADAARACADAARLRADAARVRAEAARALAEAAAAHCRESWW